MGFFFSMKFSIRIGGDVGANTGAKKTGSGVAPKWAECFEVIRTLRGQKSDLLLAVDLRRQEDAGVHQ